MKALSAIILIIGIAIGFGVGYTFSLIVNTSEDSLGRTWHYVTSFNMSSGTPTMPNFEIGYSYPNMYNETGPPFNVTANTWRAKLQTIPYYTYLVDGSKHIVYYAPTPISLKVIQINNPDGLPRVVGSIAVFEPGVYRDVYGNPIPLTKWEYRPPVSYVRTNAEYTSVAATHLFSGPGTYRIKFVEPQIVNSTGCFQFIIEEYR